MRKMFMSGALAAALVLGAGAPALAGEVRGPSGKDTPIRDGRAASICAFSGYNDTFSGDPDVPDEEGFTRTQNWGQLPSEFRAGLRSGEIPWDHAAPPNVACNPSGSR